MNHIDRINHVLEYIEENIDTKLDLSLLAAQSALSKYHFHRIFKALLGEQPLKYIEKRRLARAAHDLMNTDRRIVDIAFDFGFESHESFIRVFKKNYFVTPSKFRKIKPRIQFQNRIRIGSLDLKLLHGKVKPNLTILQKEAFSIVGLKYSGHDINQVDRLWETFWQLMGAQIVNAGVIKYFGVCFHDMDMRSSERFDYYAGFEMNHLISSPEVLTRVEVPKNDYALFTHKGPIGTIEDTYDQIYGNWLPNSEYTPTMDLDVTVVDSRFSGQDEKSEVDILIPVTLEKKQDTSRNNR